MAGKWEGFTEEDIRNLNKSSTSNSDCKASSSPVSKHLSNKNRYIKKNVVRERMLQGSKYYLNSKNICEIPKEARLFIPQIPEEEEEEVTVGNKKSEPNHLEINRNIENKMNNEETPAITDNVKPSLHSRNESILSSNNTDIAVLEEFEERQKRMKEQNRLRKEFLKKTIEDRTKKTHAEVRRLHQIEGELKKLDDQLITDVAILRDQIETASLEFMEAQKRFDISEREYLDAKLALFNKKERKELLTSHLCTIIEHNELRKAKKLSELMEKLELGCPTSNFLVTQLPISEVIQENYLTEVTNNTKITPTNEKSSTGEAENKQI